MRWTAQGRQLWIPGLTLAFLPAIGLAQGPVRLTAASAFVCDSTGRFDEANYWNTRAGDQAADLFVARDDIDGAIVNGDTSRALDLELAPGSHRLAFLCEAGVEGAAFGINLSLDGSSLPQLSVFVAPRTTKDAPLPPFHANGSVVYAGGERGSAGFTTLGSGAVAVELGDHRVEIVDLWWARKPVFAIDRVGKFQAAPDGNDEHVAEILITVSEVGPGQSFRRGDVDGSGALAITDPIRVLRFVFTLHSIGCEEAADADDNGSIEITDAIRLLRFLYAGALPPPTPFPDCAPDTDGDALDCAGSPACD